MLRNLTRAEYSHLDVEGYNAKQESILVRAVQLLEGTKLPKVAIDLGAGKGRDTKFLLEKGFSVFAVEIDEESIESLKQLECEQLHILDSSMDNIDLKALPEQLTLINASYSLPYAGKAGVNKVLPELSDKLALSGIFCGQFFGPRCSFVTAAPTEVASHSQKDIVELFSACNLATESIDLEQGPGKRMDNEPCEKDFIHVLARKTK